MRLTTCVFLLLLASALVPAGIFAQAASAEGTKAVVLANPDFGEPGPAGMKPVQDGKPGSPAARESAGSGDGKIPGLPGWQIEAWIKGEDAGSARIISGLGPDASGCLEITCRVPNDLRVFQALELVPGRTYRASCKVLARNVGTQGVGACMSLAGTNLRSPDLKGGSKDWTDLVWYFECPKGEQVRFALGIGGYGAICPGTALFDQVRLEEAGEVPRGVQVSGLGEGSGSLGAKAAGPGVEIPVMPLAVWVLLGLLVILGAAFLFREARGRNRREP